MLHSMIFVRCYSPRAASCTNTRASTLCRNMSGFSRMLDLGGSPTEHSSSVVRTVNASKNSKIQAVCFDFEVLTRHTSDDTSDQGVTTTSGASTRTHAAVATATTKKNMIQPDMEAVQNVAKLLNVNLNPNDRKSTNSDELSLQEERDLERMMGVKDNAPCPPPLATTRAAPKDYNPLDNDIRSKYANKLAQKGASATTSSSSSFKGDASFHLAARAAAVTDAASHGGGGHKWLAQTGTGALLQYLTRRSIYLALLPKPHDTKTAAATTTTTTSSSSSSSSLQAMQDFQKQIKSTVVLDVLTPNPDNQQSAQQLLQATVDKLGYTQEPSRVLIVSDRDDYLRAAKDLQCVACRIHKQGQPRGNVSAHYTVPDLSQVQTVVDEMNGISFNAMAKRR